MKYVVTIEEPYEGGYPIGVFDSFEEAEKKIRKELNKKYFSSTLVIYKVKEEVIDDDTYRFAVSFKKDKDGTITSHNRQE